LTQTQFLLHNLRNNEKIVHAAEGCRTSAGLSRFRQQSIRVILNYLDVGMKVVALKSKFEKATEVQKTFRSFRNFKNHSSGTLRSKKLPMASQDFRFPTQPQ
jgi:hypothetical protein